MPLDLRTFRQVPENTHTSGALTAIFVFVGEAESFFPDDGRVREICRAMMLSFRNGEFKIHLMPSRTAFIDVFGLDGTETKTGGSKGAHQASHADQPASKSQGCQGSI